MSHASPASAAVSSAAVSAGIRRFDPETVRADFPALHQDVRGHPLVYVDNAATTQKPVAVIEAVADYYRHDNANVHRGVHALSERATAHYEAARRTVARFLGAASSEEIVFVRGCTEAINLVASAYARPRLTPGDEIVITAMEHHSNIVPWQLACEATGARLVVAPVNDRGELDVEGYRACLGDRTRIVAVTHVSNALGTVVPLKDVIEAAHAVGAVVLVDGAQAMPHIPVDVQDLGCDFYAMSGHKVYGPTGIGALFGRREILASMPPYQGGGEMIRSVTFVKTEYAEPPARFEAGTPNIAGAIGLGSALEYVSRIGLPELGAHEHRLLAYATEQVASLPGTRIVGTARQKAGVLSFVMDDVHPHDIGTIVDSQGVAIRAGHHCAQPVMDRFGLPGTARASFAMYNTTADVDRLVAALAHVREIFG